MASLKKTPLFDYHFEVSAKMIPVGSWTMPLQFGDGMRAEYLHSLEGCCITDLCCNNIYRMTGKNFEKMQTIVPELAIGEGDVCCWFKDDRLIDTPTVIQMGEDDLLTFFSPSAKVHCDRFFELTEEDDLSDIFGCIALWGSGCMEVLSRFGTDVNDWQTDTMRKIEIDGVRCIALLTAGDEKSECVYLCFDREKSDDLWIALFNTPGIWASGTGAWNIMRLQYGLPPFNTVNCPLPLLLGKWLEGDLPRAGDKIKWSVKDEDQEAQVIYSMTVPHTEESFLLFSGKFEYKCGFSGGVNDAGKGVLLSFWDK